MALKTAEQYEESLRKMHFKIYLMGELFKTPSITPSSGRR
jgi:4-hydroxybutyryl-CoA dehydratase/vinylacetyl-CoA-Delta-isomerase